MKLRVLFFSNLREITGETELDWELPLSGGAPTIGTLLDALYARWPELRAWDGRIRVAVDLEYGDRGQVLADGQEVAVMPPVQGG